MMSTRQIRMALLAAAVAFANIAAGQSSSQRVVRKAPTAADWTAISQLPDLTGVWEAGRAPAAAAAGAEGAPTGRAGGRGAAPGGGRGAAAGRGGPSLTPAYAAKVQPARPAGEENLTANCLPPGMPGIMNQPYPMEFLMTPGQITIVIEAYNQIRHIYTDGRAAQDPDPSFYGTSVGHWEGETLVVETVGFAQVPRGINFPYSDKMKIVERFKLTAPDAMSVETTIVDPEALTEPYSMGSRTLIRHRNWTIAEFICEENNRNFRDEQGKAGINLANPTSSAK